MKLYRYPNGIKIIVQDNDGEYTFNPSVNDDKYTSVTKSKEDLKSVGFSVGDMVDVIHSKIQHDLALERIKNENKSYERLVYDIKPEVENV